MSSSDTTKTGKTEDEIDRHGAVDRRAGRCPFALEDAVPSRRALLLGAGVASGAALFRGGSASAQGTTEPPTHDHTISTDSLAADHTHDAKPHDFDNDGTREAQPFYGLHQSGVVNPQPAAAILAAFDVLATDRAGLQRLFRDLTKRIAFLVKGGEVQITNPQMPPPDNFVLGPDVFPDNLTVTVALGASLFDGRFGFAEQKPLHLVTMEQFPNDALEASFCHGDLLLQFCSNTPETNIHALRELIRATPDSLSLRWKMDGFLPPHTLKKLGKDTIRNLMGFKDGTANIDAANTGLMDELVWVGAKHNEPDWAAGGSYQAVRLIRMLVERWDRTPLGEQQTIFGREKVNGAPLGMVHERDIPNYSADAQGKTIPTDAAHPPGQPAHAGDPGQLDPAPAVQLFARQRHQGGPARHGPRLHLFPGRSRRGVPGGAGAPQRRAAGGIHQAVRRWLFLCRARRSRCRRLSGQGTDRAQPGLKVGPATLKSPGRRRARSRPTSRPKASARKVRSGFRTKPMRHNRLKRRTESKIRSEALRQA